MCLSSIRTNPSNNNGGHGGSSQNPLVLVISHIYVPPDKDDSCTEHFREWCEYFQFLDRETEGIDTQIKEK